MPTQRLFSPVLLIAALVSVASAGIRGPGKYCGAVVFDRWDACTLYSGIYVMYITEAEKEKLREHAGRWVQIDTKKVHQPINPGDGLISEVSYLEPAPSTRDWVSLDDLSIQVSPTFANGERPSINLSIVNTGAKEVTVFSSELAPTLLAKKTGRESPFTTSDGPSFALITRQAFSVGPDREARTSGRVIQDGRSYGWAADARLPDTFVLKQGEGQSVTIWFEVPEGEYDFLAGYGGGVHEGKGIASSLVAFDVDKDGNGTLAKITGR